ncbi:DASH complex subunit dad2 [Yamadazyma tenuis]|uniref:DASH complex subunit DAD2 n=1 Tax=Candida tenuis (strain ATCC 10573 / BCRC 21748 / CBS 615 / JCM 9827 / NBRC 10315 / NRRL Y-1498 / VKM Y-70) TaxID=590646 RepID=G3B0B8_CANTC|nr:uncharacterized protein CANTEDRAFT_113085 [Yamadazyma tenuis ATCC 10573]XP_006685210.1 uncharacterized protein CANTEDRAFT_113085 [Yamadazyma tenuis ATCC 10573]EGV65523.1 hypothetical protein CANTEDRAFT_113085 [Yamadazyma tenuis ATCC 10573]EGV65524.1 hypothetical protein CANTEDRAFT_113085 [Yamadazyma tenuis ATCC 10573]WEJ94975.1 DASH complex subunit dad2 [Yamadazyma tenuis]
MQKSGQIYQKIDEKRAELASLTEIKDYTERLTSQLEVLETKLEEMVDGAESVNLVLSTWQNVVRSISLASLGLYKYSQNDYESSTPLPEGLLRIKVIPEGEDDVDVDEVNADATDTRDV